MTTTDVPRHGIGPLGTQIDPCCHLLALMTSGFLLCYSQQLRTPQIEPPACRSPGALTPLAVTSTLQSRCGDLQAKWGLTTFDRCCWSTLVS